MTHSTPPLGLLCALAVSTTALKAQQPNIVIILADDMGYGDVRALNPASRIATPHIDSMCAQGLIFTDGHTNSSVSTPSRYGLLTGRYAFRSALKKGVLNGYSKALIPPERTTLAGMLAKQGYHTACIGKWHLGWSWAGHTAKDIDFAAPITNGPMDVGFQYFYGISASLDMPPYVYVHNNKVVSPPTRNIEAGKGKGFYRAGVASPDFDHQQCLPTLTHKAVEYIQSRHHQAQPFFLYLPLTAPHTPILPTAAYQGASQIAPYADFVMMVDHVVGQITKALKDNGLDQNTIVIFTSDNGCSPSADLATLNAAGHYPNSIYRGGKADLYDGGHRVPLILCWGNRYQHIEEPSVVCLTDLFATFAQLTGYPLPHHQAEDSYSLMPLLMRNGAIARTSVVHHSVNGSFAIRNSRWKLLLTPSSGGWSYPNPTKDAKLLPSLPQVQLYDMLSDPQEKNNVYAQHPEVVAQLSQELQAIIDNGRSTPGAIQPNDKAGNTPDEND